MSRERVAIGGTLEAVARADPAAREIEGQEENPQHHVLENVRAFMITELDVRLLRVAGACGVGEAVGVQIVSGMHDHVAEGDCPTRPPGPAVKDQRKVLATDVQMGAERHAGASNQQPEGGVGKRPERPQTTQCGDQQAAHATYTERFASQ